MTDTTLFAPRGSQASVTTFLKSHVQSFVAASRALFSLWYHNYRTRQELAAMSHLERCDLGFDGEIDAEIAKPFWKR